jgi:FtsP/CotA-like multicopper oxidase with cupredoxin domain
MIDGSGNGQYQRLNVQAGKKYRLRFVNTAMDHLFHVSMDGHPFTVIQADFVPTKPYQTTDLKLNVGQRYDIVFEANQAIANYWLRVSAAKPGPQGPICGEALIYQHNVTSSVVGAVLSYDGAADALPTSSPYSNDGTCNDETFVPHFTTPRSGQYNLDALNITSGPPTEPVVHWYINGTTMDGEEFS